MIYKLNKNGISKLKGIITDTVKGEETLVKLQCDINNVLLHKAQSLLRNDYILWFGNSKDKLSDIAKQKSDFFTDDDFDKQEMFVLNKHGKSKLHDSGITDDEFKNRCYMVEDKFRKLFMTDFDKTLTITVFGKTFDFNDFF